MTQRELKKRYDPDLGRYVNKNIFTGEIYGKGMSDIFISVGSKILRKAAKNATKKAATTTGNYAGKKGGDRIVELLSNNNTTTPSIMIETPSKSKVLTTKEINDRVNKILSGGKLRRSKFI